MIKFKKQTWVIIIVVVGLIMAAALAFCLMFARSADVKDGMFYEVKCRYGMENKSYSMIIDHKPAAVAFKEDMESTDSEFGDRASCDLTTYAKATNDALFMYAIVTVLNNVTFAFKEESARDDTYQIQFFTAADDIVALSCRYRDAQFDCYNELPITDCPSRQADALKLLKGKCEYKVLG